MRAVGVPEMCPPGRLAAAAATAGVAPATACVAFIPWAYAGRKTAGTRGAAARRHVPPHDAGVPGPVGQCLHSDNLRRAALDCALCGLFCHSSEDCRARLAGDRSGSPGALPSPRCADCSC